MLHQRLLPAAQGFLKRAMSSAATSGRLNGKIAIVTASTDGIGFSIAKKLLLDGAKVMISSRKSKNVERALQEIASIGGINKDSVKGMVCHVGSPEDRTKLVNQTLSDFGGIDILVSNAAVNPHFGPTLDCPETSWDKIFEINVKAAFLLTKEVTPHIVKRKGGSVVYISSIAGFNALSLLGAYSVSKTALLGLTKVLAQELAPDNVRVNCVCPGIIRTNFSSALTSNQEVHDKILEQIPLQRVGVPDEIGGVVSFLVSDDASYLTGENIVVSGGMNSRL